MENAIAGLIIIGVLILAILGLTQSSLSTQAAMADAIRAMEMRLTDQGRTNLSGLSGSTSSLGDAVFITVKNTGSTKLADFEHWDVILDYTDLASTPHTEWHAYGNWTKQIYIDAPATLERIEPSILNPGEEMVITVPVSFTIGTGTINSAIVATPNGITASATFTR
jgi:archaellum component FlaF (FlaF/FlaG flagellin family)